MNEEAISLRQCLNFGVFKPHLFAVDILGIRALDLFSNLHLSLQNMTKVIRPNPFPQTGSLVNSQTHLVML